MRAPSRSPRPASDAPRPGLRTVGTAIAALADDPYPDPSVGFHRGRYHRLRVGAYRIMYVVDENVITIERVDRLMRD